MSLFILIGIAAVIGAAIGFGIAYLYYRSPAPFMLSNDEYADREKEKSEYEAFKAARRDKRAADYEAEFPRMCEVCRTNPAREPYGTTCGPACSRVTGR